MPHDPTKPTPTSMLFDGERCDRYVRGGLAIHLDRSGHALTVGEPGRKRLPDERDIQDLEDDGRAVPVPFEEPGIPPIIRGVRQPLPDTGPRVAGRLTAMEAAAVATEARIAADDALTMAAFVLLTDDETDDLDAYEIYLRSFAGIRRRNAGVDVPMAMPSRFRDRVERVAAELARMGAEPGEAPTVH